MKKMNMKKYVLLVCLLVSAGAFAQPLKLSLAKGKKYEVNTVTKMTTVTSVMGQEMESSVDNSSVEAIEVKDIRANETDLTRTVTKMVANVQAMGQDMSYDSEKKDTTGPLAESLNKLVGKTKNMTVDANGKVIKEDTDNDDLTSNMGMMMAGTVSGGVAIYRASLLGKELKPGASWPDSMTSVSDKMKTTTVGTYTVAGIEGKIASIVFTGTQAIAGTVEQMGQEMGVSGNNKVNYQIKVDISTGVITESVVTTDGTSNIEAMGMSIPVTSKVTVTTSVKSL